MTTTIRPSTNTPGRARSHRQTALVVGVLFLVTYVTSIAAKFGFYAPLFDDSEYVLSAGSDTRVAWGAFNEMILIIANIGTAVALYPLLKRQHQPLALGFVTARVMESVFIAVGVVSALAIVTMRQDAAAGDVDPAGLAAVGHALTAMQEWTFNLGPGFVVGVGNGLILGYLMYRTGLVPRQLAVLGLVGGSLICLSGTAVMLGTIDAGSTLHNLAAAPEFFWELSLAIYLVVKGFRPSPVLES